MAVCIASCESGISQGRESVRPHARRYNDGTLVPGASVSAKRIQHRERTLPATAFVLRPREENCRLEGIE